MRCRLAWRLFSDDDQLVIYRVAFLLFGLTTGALAQSRECTPTPALETGLAIRSCDVLRRADLGAGLSWEVQERRYAPPRAGSGDAVLRLTVVLQRGEAVAWTEPGYGSLSRPERFVSPRGTLLRLPVSAGPTERTLDEVWLRREPLGAWSRLGAQSWREEAQRRLRPGETLDAFHRLELRPLRATGRVNRASDAPCCPGGGHYTAWLDLGEDKLVLVGFSRR